MADAATRSHRRNWPRIILWAIRIVLCAAFLAAAFFKLTAAPVMVSEFNRIGLGQWFRYFTGACELSGAVLIVMPMLAGVGALILACVMIGAVLTELLVLHDSVVPAAVLGVLSLIVLIARRADVLRIKRIWKRAR